MKSTADLGTIPALVALVVVCGSVASLHGQSRPTSTSPVAAAAAAIVLGPIDVSGQVVDDETGKPISQFSQQGGRVDDKDPSQVHWGYSLQTQSKNPKGQFTSHIDWAGGWRERIIAGGYISQPILSE